MGDTGEAVTQSRQMCPSQQRVFVRPRETNPDWVCVINFNRGMFYVSLLMGHCISILTESSITLFVTSSYNAIMKASSISNQMIIRVYSSRLLWYQIDVLRCNSILSESCLVSSNKLAWLSPDPGLWYGALSSGNEIINIIARTRDSSLRKSYLYCEIGSHEKIGRRSWRTTWLTRNNLQQMVNSF